MHAILRVTSGAGRGRNLTIRPGQQVQIGRTEWADLCIDDDPEMSDVHFAVECDYQGCRIRDLGSQSGTTVAGEPVDVKTLRSGDVIAASRTSFEVHIEGAAAPSGDAAQESTAAEPFVLIPQSTAKEICALYNVEDEAAPHLKDGLAPREFVDALLANDLPLAAIRFLAHALPKQEACWWASRCLVQGNPDALSPPEEAALKAAVAWIENPSEENRRSAGAAGQSRASSTAAGYLALAVFNTGGSIGAPDGPQVPPPDTMTAAFVGVTVALAAPAESLDEAKRHMADFVRLGCEIADGGAKSA